MSVADRCFLDSNILLYAIDIADVYKQQQAQALQVQLLAQHRAVVSYQVIQEFLNTSLRRFKHLLSAQDALTIADTVLWPMCRVMPSSELLTQALRLHTRYGYSFYDSLILAAAIEARCGRLYSEDLQHGQKIEGVEIINPFLDIAAKKPKPKKSSAGKKPKG